MLVQAVSSVPGNFSQPQSSGLDLEYVQISDPGRVRGHNEDFLGCAAPDAPDRLNTHGWLFALADGVGGHDKGEVASKLAVEALLAGFREAVAGEPHPSLLQRLVQAANIQVYETGRAASPGGVAMAANDRGVVYEGAFGKRELGKDAPMTVDTVVWIASMTKAITATAAM